MQGKQIFQQPLFVTIDIAKLVPKNHLLRRVEQVIDFSFIREMTAELYSHDRGRPSLDPELFLRMTFISYLYNISSDRQLCDEICYNMCYRWFCRISLADQVPDHSTLTRTRLRLGEETFKKVFQNIVQICIDKGLVVGQSVMTDSTLILANASSEAVAVKKEHEFEVRRQTELKNREKVCNRTHVSTTDPDATFAVKPNSPQGLKYKAHTTIDANSRVILDCHVTTGATHDSVPYLWRLDRVKVTFPILEMKNAIADRAYGTGKVLLGLEKRQIDGLIPLFHRQTGHIREEKVGFVYDGDNDFYVCPQGQKLYPGESTSGMRKRYVVAEQACASCPLKKTCCSEHPGKSKFIYRSLYQDQFQRVLDRERSSIFKQKVRERLWKIEGINAEGKNLHGLDRARYRGRWKMQVQAFMTAIVQNVKRLLDFDVERGTPAMAKALAFAIPLVAALLSLLEGFLTMETDFRFRDTSSGEISTLSWCTTRSERNGLINRPLRL